MSLALPSHVRSKTASVSCVCGSIWSLQQRITRCRQALGEGYGTVYKPSLALSRAMSLQYQAGLPLMRLCCCCCCHSCTRYLASRCEDPLLLDRGGGASRRSAAVRLQPASLAGSVLYSSPLSARSLSLSGRGKLADRGTIYTSKVSLVQQY